MPSNKYRYEKHSMVRKGMMTGDHMYKLSPSLVKQPYVWNPEASGNKQSSGNYQSSIKLKLQGNSFGSSL